MHVGFALVLGFFLFPVAQRFRHRFMPWDVALIAVSLYVIWYLIAGGDDLQDRYIFPEADGPRGRLAADRRWCWR